MKKYLLSVDNGGTYIKAAIHDLCGKQIALTREYNRVIIPKADWSEYDLDELWETNCRCIRKLISATGIQPEEIACIGLCAQGSGYYALDENDRSIRNAITSSDGRGKMIVKKWFEEGLLDEVYDSIYHYSWSGHLNTILAWLKENEPENYQKSIRLFTLKDYLVYRLTGNFISSYDCQSQSGLLDMRSRTFTPELSAKFGIPEAAGRFGELKWGTELCGEIGPKAAQACGLIPGIPVSAGCHDVIATAIAMGVTDSEYCFMITGTHGINGYISDTPVLNKTISNNEMFAEDGKYLIEEGYPSSSGTLEWAISVLFADDKRSSTEIYEEINASVASIDPADSRLIFTPYLRGSRDDERAEGTWIGLKPFHTRAHMLEALYEGVAFAHKNQLAHLFMNRPLPAAIKTAGGATTSRVWMQMFADVLQLPLEIVRGEEMGAKGASIVAAVASGIYPDLEAAVNAMTEKGERIYPNESRRGIFEEKYEAFTRVCDALKKIWK